MSIKRLMAFVFVAALAGAAAAQTPQTALAAPAIGPTRGQAMDGFYLDVARCLYGLEHDGAGIADLPPEARADLRPATAAERFLYRDPKIKVWTNDTFGRSIVLAERDPDHCEVVAAAIPVEPTFAEVRRRLHQADAALADYPVKGGYNPIAYQLERVVNGKRFIVHLEGSEPGGLAHPGRMLMGHAMSTTLLVATVVRQPETSKPPYR